MKGIVSSVKRRVFGKEGEEVPPHQSELCLQNNTHEVNHTAYVNNVSSKLSSSPDGNKVTSENFDRAARGKDSGQESSDGPFYSPLAPSSHSVRRDKLRGRLSDSRGNKGVKRYQGSSNYSRGGDVDNSRDDTRVRKARKEYAKQSAAFTGKLYHVPMDHLTLKPGLLPNSTSTADPSIFEQLPTLRDVGTDREREIVFQNKIHACASVVFDLDQSSWAVEKEAKKTTLHELIDYVAESRISFTEAIIPDVLNMVGLNIFRDLPATTNGSFPHHPFQVEDDDLSHDPQWSHLQPVYEFFMRFILAAEVEVKVMRQYINQAFILRLLDLFQSEDSREREYLKSLLHRIYGKVMSLRQFIRRSIQNVFHRFIEGYGRPAGISELLEILGSIINGFATPLKAEHKVMLERSLIPLHKSWGYSLFQSQLQYCMIQYVQKDPSLAETIISGILRYWPIANTQKELSFVTEIEEIIGDLKSQKTDINNVKIQLFARLAECIQSSHFQVAERVLFLWHPNSSINPVVEEYREVIFPLLIGPLFANSVSHWNGVVHQLTYQVSKLMSERDGELFEKCTSELEVNKEIEEEFEEQRKTCWEFLERSHVPSNK